MRLRFWTAVLLGFGFFSLMARPAGAVDNTTCTVLDNSDSADDFNSLRRKVEQGFNRSDFRACTDLIKFGAGSELDITLVQAIHFNNDQDLDCTGDSPVCNDGIALLVDGTPNNGPVVIDTTALQDDKCAIEVTASRVTFRGFKVKTKQSQLVTANKNAESAVICDNGNHNDFSGVEIQTVGGASETCGNGVVEGKEECDDGDKNGKPGDLCTSACTKIPDKDGDGIPDDVDNCPNDPNPDQADCDKDGKGDACDNDWDNDGKPDGVDNCAPDHKTCQSAKELAALHNPDQSDIDHDGIGDVCDDDMDGDGIPNATDNCPKVANPDQKDEDGDGIGAACDPNDNPADVDTDGDGVKDSADNCPTVANPDQKDTDSDGIGDACDNDIDNDGLTNDQEAQKGTDPKNPDTDGDGIIDGVDACPLNPNPLCGENATPSPTSNPTANDADGDGIPNATDNCPNVANPDQKDGDGNGIGDACDLSNPDADSDGDGVKNGVDNCPSVSNPDQKDTDGDKIGDACDSSPGDSVGGKSGGCSLNPRSSATQDGLAWFLMAAGAAIALRVKRRFV